MTLHDLYLLAPEISLAGLGILVILLSLKESRIGVITSLALAGLAVPLGFVISLWVNLSSKHIDQMAGVFNTLSVDRFSLFFQILFIGVVAVVLLASNQYAKKFVKFRVEYIALIMFSACGLMLLASTVELISIYISLELSSLPIVALVAIAKNDKSLEAGLKYLILSAISSALLLYGIVMVYGWTGTTYLSVIAERMRDLGYLANVPMGSYPVFLGVILIVAGFGFKIASVPFQMWVPDVYEGAPTPITAYLSVASKAAGFAILLRIFYVAFSAQLINSQWAELFAILSVFSMSIGNLVAIAQNNIKRMLAFSTIAHAGYMLVGLAAISRTVGESSIGPGGVLFYLATYAGTNLAAFFAIIAISNKIGSDKIDDYIGMGKRSPLLALVLALSMVSLIGLPPTAGFMAKFYLFGAAVKSNLAWLAVIGVVNSVVSAYYYLRVVKVMYLASPESSEHMASSLPEKLAISVTSLAVVFFGIVPGPLLSFAQRAASVLMMRNSF